MIAVTQVRGDGEGAIYFAKQLTVGKTKTEALRLLRRRISDRVYRALLADQADLDQPLNPLPETGVGLAA
jgi:transposase